MFRVSVCDWSQSWVRDLSSDAPVVTKWYVMYELLKNWWEISYTPYISRQRSVYFLFKRFIVVAECTLKTRNKGIKYFTRSRRHYLASNSLENVICRSKRTSPVCEIEKNVWLQNVFIGRWHSQRLKDTASFVRTTSIRTTFVQHDVRSTTTFIRI